MRFFEIARDVRVQMREIQSLWAKYTLSRSDSDGIKVKAAINKIYPTGYSGIDKTLQEYSAIIKKEFLNRFK